MIKFTEYKVNNSITNTLTDRKFDIDKPFTFIEYLNYVKIIDNNDTENFVQYKKYLENWKLTDFDNNKDNSLNIKAIYLNFFNDLTLKYSTQEQRRFFNTIDLFDNGSLTKIIPFYRNKIVEILNYYRDKRNTFQRDLREKQGKGSNISVKDQIKNNIVNFFNSPDYTGETITLSSLRVDMELGFDDYNDYFDINPAAVPANETYLTNNINENAFIDIDKALIQVLNDNNITITELNPYKLIVEFNEVNSNFLERNDFIDYKITNRNDTYRVLFEAELAENLVGTDYFYLSTTETKYVSGKLFEAKNKAKNLFNINFPSTLAKETLPTKHERSVGLFFNPTKFSILRVDGEYITKIKKELKDNFVYVFPDPAQYGDVVNLSNTKRDNPFNFFFDQSSYKNISSSSSRKTVKANERNHYFHSYQSVQNRRINITNDGTFPDSATNLTNYGSIDKIESDIYGNEYIQMIPNKGVIKNTEDKTIIQNKKIFKSGNTIDVSENRYGDIESLSGLSDKIYSFKEIYIKDAVTKLLLPLSASNFHLIYDKFKFNTLLYNQLLNNKISDINVYENTISIDLRSFSIIDTFKYDGTYIEQTSSPLIIEKDNTGVSFITPDCYHDNSIYKFNINLNNLNSPNNNSFYFELFKYNTNKKIIEEISTRNNETSSYFFETFTFDNSIKIKKIDNSSLTFNSYDNSFLLTTTFIRENIFDSSDSFCIHYLNFKIVNSKLIINKNNFYTNYNDSNLEDVQMVKSKGFGFINSNLLQDNTVTLPIISFPVTDTTTSLNIAYSGSVDANFVLDNVTQSSGGLSLYKAEIDFGDGTSDIVYSRFLSSGNLKLDNFNHQYTPFNASLSSSGSIVFYYENGKTATVNLSLFKIVTDMNSLNFKTINSQKTNSNNFICNLVDKNNTIYNFIDSSNLKIEDETAPFNEEKFMTYDFNIDFDLTGVPVTSFSPYGNENDRPRINTFREDGEFTIFLDAGGIYYDSSTSLSSIPPWGDRSTGSFSFSVPTVSGLAGSSSTPKTLSAGVDVFAADYMTVNLVPPLSTWTETTPNPGEKKYQLLFNTEGTKNISVTIVP